MNKITTKITLAVSGAVLALIGGALVLTPRAFIGMSGVVVQQDASLASELVAPSGVLLITGALMLIAVAKPRFVSIALMTGAIVYGSYGSARLVGMILHGVPSQSLIGATIIELGFASLLLVLRGRHNDDL